MLLVGDLTGLKMKVVAFVDFAVAAYGYDVRNQTATHSVLFRTLHFSLGQSPSQKYVVFIINNIKPVFIFPFKLMVVSSCLVLISVGLCHSKCK